MPTPVIPLAVDAENETLASALNNFILNFYGAIAKTVVNGEVVWVLPCDLATAIPGYPRDPSLGTACYFKSLFTTFGVQITAAQAAAVAAQASAANATALATAAQLTANGAQTSASTALALIAALGTMSAQNANNVAVSGGTITGAHVTGLASPTSASDAATKQYADSLAGGIIPKTAVGLASTANLTLSGEQTIDGVLTSASRILVKNQTLTQNNGIYTTAAGAWTRALDSDTAGELLVNQYYFVPAGTVNAGTGWFISTAPTTLGTDPLLFSQFSASSTYTAGTGLTLAGSQFSLNGTQTGLTLNASAFNGTIGATVPSTAVFTTLTTSGNSYLANLVIKGGQLNETATNGLASVDFNYDGYSGGTTQFRSVNVYDGKNALVATFTGSTKSLNVVSGLTAVRLGINVTAPSGEIYGHFQKGSAGGTPAWNSTDVALLENTAGANANLQILSSTGSGVSFSNPSVRARGSIFYNHATDVLTLAASGATAASFTSTGMNTTVIGATTPAAATFTTLTAPSSTTNSTFFVGNTEIQNYAVNNSWIANNTYFDGTVFRYRNTGYIQQLAFSTAGDIVFVLGSSQVAGTDATATRAVVGRFTLTGLNAAAIGATTPSTGAFTTLSATGAITSTKTGQVFSAASSTTGPASLVLSNTTGAVQLAVEDSTGGTYGATAYDALLFTGAGRGIAMVVSGTGMVGRFSSSGLAVTGTITGSSTATGGSTSRTLANRFADIINVKDYGATGDGSTNDVAAINAAIAAMANYKTLYFPPGRYRVTSACNQFAGLSHIAVIGADATILNDTGASGANTFVFTHTCSDVIVRNLRFVGTATVRGTGIHIRGYCSDLQITGCYFTKSSDFAVHISNDTGDTTASVNVLVANNIFNDTLGDGVHVSSAENVVIANNAFRNTGDDAIAAVRDSLTASAAPTRVVIIGNTISRAGYGTAAVSGAGIRLAEVIDVLVEGNIIDYTYQAPIFVERYLSTSAFNYRVQIVGNKIVNGNQLAGALGSISLSFCQGVTVDNNNIDDAATGCGISFLDCNDAIIQNNRLRNIPSRGIASDDATTTNVAASATRVWILNNSLLYTLANEAIYVVAPTGKTITDFIIAGNNAGTVPAGNYIYYDRVSNGKICNNIQLAANTIGAGGTVASVTLVNNN